jgi:hypothetical protein
MDTPDTSAHLTAAECAARTGLTALGTIKSIGDPRSIGIPLWSF